MLRVWIHRISALDEAEEKTGCVHTIHGPQDVPDDCALYAEGDSLVWAPDAPGYGAAVLRGGLASDVARWLHHPVIRVIGGLGCKIEVV